ncbi:CRS2-associated factor 1, chloroplastic [Olea europaea subsp. europaea]|uniref:CRS2-associated factor 1, chloroplastic n=1 Tax=Olea europaea subsp. europaea TaxID=158383 RepID=A0A8S0QVM5_OLEEU|nr:CRS2-associated factor 1, chloroplastic [Olea europaea subsp. europaea]
MSLKTVIQFPIFSPPDQRRYLATEVRFSWWNNANAEKFIRHDREQKEIEGELRVEKRFDSALNIAHNYNPDPHHFQVHWHPFFTFHTWKILQYTYTETPKLKPLKLREPLVSPFGPSSIPKPWLGRKPLPPCKKLPEFDSLQLPPAHEKGVNPVQAPGPFLPGSGPKSSFEGCKKSQGQLNMGRDGLTHNMLDNIHAHWKRRRVCKIKCKGVCTVDMDNICQTGGKVIYNRGGVIYLFCGRNYNYKTRPLFPLMLWKPITPVYPRLIKRVPEGFTLEEASQIWKLGHNLTAICKLERHLKHVH